MGLITSELEFEKKPQEALAKFQEADSRVEAQKKEQRQTRLKQALGSGWSKALSANSGLPEDRRIPEFMEVTGKAEHNEKVVRPILGNAQKSFVAVMEHINKLIETGSSIDDNLAQFLAANILYGTAVPSMHHSRLGLYEKNKELQGQLTKHNGFERPSMTSPRRSHSTKSGEKRKLSGKEASAEIFRAVQEEMSVE